MKRAGIAKKMADFKELNANLLTQNHPEHEREHKSAVCTNGTTAKFNRARTAGEPIRERTRG